MTSERCTGPTSAVAAAVIELSKVDRHHQQPRYTSSHAAAPITTTQRRVSRTCTMYDGTSPSPGRPACRTRARRINDSGGQVVGELEGGKNSGGRLQGRDDATKPMQRAFGCCKSHCTPTYVDNKPPAILHKTRRCRLVAHRRAGHRCRLEWPCSCPAANAQEEQSMGAWGEGDKVRRKQSGKAWLLRYQPMIHGRGRQGEWWAGAGGGDVPLGR